MSFLQPKALQLILRDFYRAMGQESPSLMAIVSKHAATQRKVIEPDQAFLVDGGCCEGVGCKGTMVRNQLLLHGDPMEKTRETAN
eukprot:symbB.v1.2.014864.t1/scaffold1095.1/size138309/12